MNQPTVAASTGTPARAIQRPPRFFVGLVAAIAGTLLLIHLLMSGRYGYFRDEMYYLDCARHLAWGYVDLAPMIAWLARIALALGGSLPVLRTYPAVAGALLVVLTMRMTWRLGGDWFAQALAGLSIACVPIYMATDGLFTMNAFEPLFWMACINILMKFIQTGDSKLWIWFGVFAGLGLMNKHSTAFFGLAVVVGLLLTEHRREFQKPWIWIGGAIALLIFSPNLIWQVAHHFPTLEDLHNVRVTHKNVELPTLAFIKQQVLVMGPVLFPFWFAGLWHFMFGRGTKYRILAWIFLSFFLMMLALQGKDYYVVPMYPMLFAGGAVAWENTFGRWRILKGRLWPKVLLLGVIMLGGIVIAPAMMPILSPEQTVAYAAKLGVKPAKQEVNHESLLPQYFADQFGWPELVEQVAAVYNALPPEERARTAIVTGNYGEAGAIDLFGPKYGLPSAISGHQTHYYWGINGFTGDNLILIQFDRDDVQDICTSADEVAKHYNPWGMAEENHVIVLCRGLKQPLSHYWPEFKHWN
jgi:hypothetical protein